MDYLHNLSTSVVGAPMWVGLLAAGQAAVLAALMFVAIRRRKPTRPSPRNHLGDGLLAAALAFCSVVLVAYVVGTYEGSTAFAMDKLGWTNWRKAIPWATLDAAGFGFSLLWLRAIVLERSPIRPRRVVFMTAGFSAVIQMLQGGQQHRWQAGLFLAFLAGVGWILVHTLVEQLRGGEQDDTAWRRYPKFAARWITYFPNTLCAWLAWVNHPVADGLEPTIGNAVVHLDEVRAAKVSAGGRAFANRAAFPRWTVLTPWIRTRHMVAAFAAVRDESARQIAELTERMFETETEHAARLATMEAEHATALEAERRSGGNRSTSLEQRLAAVTAAAEHRAEQLRGAHAEQVERLKAEHAEQMSRLRAEREAEQARGETPERSANGHTPRSKQAERRTGAVAMTDTEAVKAMLAEHPERDYEWGSREVRRLTGAGFGRVEKLIAMVAEHHDRSGSEHPTGAPHRSTTEQVS